MPFTALDYPILSPEQTSPLAGAIKGLLSGIKEAPSMYTQMVKAKYALPEEQQALQKAVLENQWNPKLWQSQIGLQGAQAGLYNQQAKYYPQATQSEIELRKAQAASANAEAQMNQVKLNYIRQATGLGQPAPQPETQPSPQTQAVSNALQPSNGQQPANQQSPSGLPVSSNAVSSAMGNQSQPSYGANPANPANPANVANPVASNVPVSNQAVSNAMQAPAQLAQQTAQAPIAAPAQPNVMPIPQQPSNMSYGIETPMPTRDDNINKMIFGIDTYTPKLAAAVEQQKGQMKLYQDDISAASQRANKALETKQYLSTYNNSMDRSRYTGQVLGNVPSKGIATVFLGNMSPEQEADRAAAKLLIGGIGDLTDVMGKAHFSSIDMKVAQDPKFSRTMNKEPRQMATDFQNGVIARTNEEPKFLTAISSNPKTAPLKSIADMAWRNYQEEFPLTKETKKGMVYQGEDSLNKWPIFTTPKAIDSIRRNGFYKPTQAERDAHYMLLPDKSGQYHIMPIASKAVGDAVKKYGAMPL